MKLTTAEKSARYRAKDVEAYRKKKREYAKTPEQREKRREYMRKWMDKNRERFNFLCNRSHAKCRKVRGPAHRREIYIKWAYGIGSEQCKRILLSQGGGCGICASPSPRWKHSWHIDHCHNSGKIRGLLCNRCNTALGWHEKHVQKITEYLSRDTGYVKRRK